MITHKSTMLAAAMTAAFAATAGLSRPAHAQQNGSENDWEENDGGDWDARVGAGVLFNPEFNGSKTLEIIPIPVLDITWRNRIFLNTQNGLGLWLVKSDDDPKYLGLSVGYNFDDRESSAIAGLEGLDDIDGTIEAKLLAGFELGLIDVEFEAARAIGSDGHDGFRMELAAGLGVPVGNRAFVEFAPFVTWGDDSYNNSLYGVSAAEAVTSNFREFDAGSGFEKVGAELEGNFLFTDRIGIYLNGEYSRLVGGAADSPFIRTKNQFEAIGGLYYRF